MSTRRGTRGRAAVAAVFALVLVVGGGCGRTPSAEVPVDAPASEDPSPAPGSPPQLRPEQPRRSTSIDLPRLPVGGDSQAVAGRAGTSCVSVSWIVDPAGPGALQPGIGVAVRRVRFEPAVFERVPGSCVAGVPECVGYTFSAASNAPACVITVWTRTPGATAEVLLRGAVRCADDVAQSDCAAFAAGAGDTPSQLQVTDERAPETPSPDPSGG